MVGRPVRVLGAVLAAVAVVATLTACDPSTPAAEPLDCTDWRYGPADEPSSLPPELDRDDYKRSSLRDPALASSPQNLCGQKGAAVDLALGLSRGLPTVTIAVLDSGIEWRNAGDMADLAAKAHINLGEAKPPCWPRPRTGDCNGDGSFDIRDFGDVVDRNGNGLADPEDLILDPSFSDGRDDDRNGYVDDIAGWDFLYGDNNPLDTVEYGHGTGEAKDSTALEDGQRDVGSCPGCQFLPVRVSDSFIADGGRFAAGVLFALDSGADVVQEALGTISNPRQAQQAIDAAYERGVVVVASMADEASKHPNLPASLERTMAVNSITERTTNPLGGGTVDGYLALNGCTNYGGRTFVAVPSDSCSSEATGQSAGMVGLLESYAREVGIRPAARRGPHRSGGNVLTANEAMQIVRASADDVDFATPNDVDPANNFGTSNGSPLLDTVRYPTTPGWDATFGYGRVNAYEMLKAVRDGRIPPEAQLDGPSWFALLPTTGKVAITGHVAAERARTYDYRVEWAPGLQPPAYPGADTWTTVGSGTGLRSAKSGRLATLDLATVAAALPGGGTGTPSDGTAANRPDEERFSVRIRVVVTAHGGRGDGLIGESQKQVFVHDDPDLVAGFPKAIAGVGTSSPSFVDVDGDGRNELLVATDDGEIHAYRSSGRELRGFPLRADRSDWWPRRSSTARRERIADHRGAFMVGAPAVADLDGDGRNEVVATDLDGNAYVWSSRGRRLATMSVDRDFSRDDVAAQDERNRTKPGFASSPAVGDLDGDGTLEVIAAAMDRHVYAWHHDGSPVDGFPVLAVDPAKVAAVDAVTHTVTFTAESGIQEGGELVAAPTVADLTGDGRPEIIVGAQEAYAEPPNIADGASILALIGSAADLANSRLYAISPDGTTATNPDRSAAHPDDQAYVPGWPAKVPQLLAELLPTIGDGVAMPAAVGDVNLANPGPEVVAASSAGVVSVLGADAQSVFGSTAAGDLPLAWAGGLGGEGLARFGAKRNTNDVLAAPVAFGGPTVGELRGGGAKEIAAPTAGLTRLLDSMAPDLQLPNDDQLSLWDGETGNHLPGSPRTTEDLAFFVSPAIADLDGDGANEAVAGNGVYVIHAVDAEGNEPSGWPKLTGGWSIGTPAVGDWDGDGRVEVAQQRRDGHLLVWRMTSTATPEWGQFACDPQRTGACATS